jgi:branched-chain amino acid transport system ATP-binding protein
MTTPLDDTSRSVMLETRAVSKRFGGLKAVDSVSLTVADGTLHSIIGPNGSGKTTLFNLITGRFPPTNGRVIFQGIDITGLPQHRIARLGLARSYQVTTIFKNLDVFENLRIAAQAQTTQFNFWRRSGSLAAINERAEQTLEIIGLQEKRQVVAGALGHAEQRQVDLGIALAQSPRLLLLDEPTAGMSPYETERMVRFIKDLAKRLAIVLVEHKMSVVMSISDRVTVLNFGQVLAEGTPAEIQQNRRVQEVYLEGSV